MTRDRAADDSAEVMMSSREAILAAAERLMTTVGYDKASISRTCRESGLPVGSLYHHFGSKAGLLAAVYQRFQTRFLDGLAQAVETAQTAEEGLAAFWDGAVQAVVDDYPYFTLTLELVRLSRDDAEIRRVVETDTRATEQHLATTLIAFTRMAGRPDADDLAHRMARVAVTYSRAAIMIAGDDQAAYRRQMEDFYPILHDLILGAKPG
ncbi:AcrR family transcriptional regulator [Kibdelosporangium banguiense]|uniref:AcrR family transcriptional regulator n=1 Tax=Kibdelosporangium banguiense TaxID=1365924 RepID=A0ABS4T7L7_9PSEU|nr:TetR/AcrR family transcriptional regulator [Kibdelosporangium banguiense]MBP2320419.1 AcrR family transcriptional regulator [Kibdelosporangium banguiense]